MRLNKYWTAAAAGLLVAGLAAPAQAVEIIDGGTGVSIDLTDPNEIGSFFDVTITTSLAAGCKSGTGDPGADQCDDLNLSQAELDALNNSFLSASLWFEITDINLTAGDDSIEFAVKILEESIYTTFFTDSTDPELNSLLHSFAVDTIIPALDGASVTNDDSLSTVDWDADTSTTFPGLGTVELCVFTPNNCTGGPGGLSLGDMDMMTLLLTGDFDSGDGTMELIIFGAKWQTNVAEFLLNVSPCTNGGPCYQESLEPFPGDVFLTEIPPVITPEPSTLTLFGVGLAGLGLFGWRQRRKAAAAA